MKYNYKAILFVSLSLMLLFGSAYGALHLLNREPSRTVNEITFEIADSEIITNSPETTAARFVYYNGRMGNIATEVSKDTLIRLNNTNVDRRLRALETVLPALIPGSPLTSTSLVNSVTNYANSLDVPTFYSVDEESIRVSNVSKIRQIDITSEYGLNTYDSVDVFVSFDSTKTIYQRARDSSWDGSYTRINNKIEIEDLKITLVQVEDLWLIYEVEDVNQVSARFATWNTNSNELINVENDRVIEVIQTWED